MIKKSVKILIGISIIFVLLLSGCSTLDKGTSNNKLTTQYTDATQYSVADGHPIPKIGVGYNVYFMSPDKVNIYSRVVYPGGAKEEFVGSSTIDVNGVIDVGYVPANASVIAAFNKIPHPTNGNLYYLYSTSGLNGYNVVIYYRNSISMNLKETDSMFAGVSALGFYKNNALTLYSLCMDSIVKKV